MNYMCEIANLSSSQPVKSCFLVIAFENVCDLFILMGVPIPWLFQSVPCLCSTWIRQFTFP